MLPHTMDSRYIRSHLNPINTYGLCKFWLLNPAPCVWMRCEDGLSLPFLHSVHGKTCLHSSHCLRNDFQRVKKRDETISYKQNTEVSVVFPCTKRDGRVSRGGLRTAAKKGRLQYAWQFLLGCRPPCTVLHYSIIQFNIEPITHFIHSANTCH